MTESEDTRILRLCNYLGRSHKYNKASILFALYLSEFLRDDVEESIKRILKEQGLNVVIVDAGENKDLPLYFSLTDSKNIIFFVHNLEKGFPETIQYLNFKREELVEHHVKVVFWTTEEELSRISVEAPDFFAFRNRVVEFMEVPEERKFRPGLVEFALETEYRSLDEIKHNIQLKESLLSDLSTDTEISGYLFASLGTLYNQIGDYKKSIDCSEKALKISKEMENKHGEAANLGNLGIAYSDLGQVEKAIEYHEQALVISREIGDRSGEGADLGNLGIAYHALGQVEKAIEYHEQALVISREIGDRREEGIWIGNLGIAYSDLGQVEKAIEYYEQALVISRETGNRSGEGNNLGNLGLAYSNLGKVEKAIEYLEKALEIGTEIKEPRITNFCEQLLNSLKILDDLNSIERKS
ncbi:tetratricopeptide repeat protein [Methanococcoides alaskense]|uniref:Tetratricopeptide (TPR) repeat protein n=1 Tax=Methanococcoides alaskense TaxID=325778 RepID=A0AA90U1H1_9EURY|nr:tetratricopeptide repeat protein [Methanococcoides alaskense]MDA0524342.1 tetratricopeptide repeat protein [Methanococcoides alaskense]MDR6223931.1 tetratricopeptide (TPR) repeat protein [Methanococcoides alaskense]